ncbi:glucosamine-6-phosphate deaminase [Microcella daejeonensis]|uniref:glucosamine-6-phosphate deaminase n=1 Tax=Microcella daejeonensis TaxID=2994971 RepID=UPI00226E3258|nr:glucosamine-6-phosphate deaminase [Microcella daejeonensis]WAB84361.1 glucosamine-6-phosphate deaminase [Microcella daejeonensis]
MTEVIIVGDAAQGGRLVAEAVWSLVARRAEAVLGLATGSSPLPVYDALRDHASRLAGVRGFALDEYVGLPPGHPQSYRAVIDREVVQPLGLDPARVRVPGDDIARRLASGDSRALAEAGERYETELDRVGGVDLQLLGIGSTGHIGFNEPGSSFASRTRMKTLTERTRSDNARFFSSPDEVPMHCITQGLGTIGRSRHLVLLAFGAQKARAIAEAVEGPVTSAHPASAIQLHPRVTVVVDEAAASRLRFADYYRHAWANKPEWQEL